MSVCPGEEYLWDESRMKEVRDKQELSKALGSLGPTGFQNVLGRED